MMIVKNAESWYEAFLDTPLSVPRAGLTHDQALMTEGAFVKTRETGPKGPAMLGRLVSVSIERDHVVVRSNEPYHDGQGNPFVWSGTVAEYKSVWRCD